MKNNKLKAVVSAVLAAAMVVSLTGVAAPVSSKADDSIYYDIAVETYDAEGEISTQYPDIDTDTLKAGDVLTEKQLGLTASPDKPSPDANFEGWYVTDYKNVEEGDGYYAETKLSDYKLPTYSEAGTDYKELIVYPKFDRMKYQQYTVAGCGENDYADKDGNWGLDEISLSKAYTDDELKAIALSKLDKDPGYGKVTARISDRKALEYINIVTDTEKVKVDTTYDYVNKNNDSVRKTVTSYIAPGDTAAVAALTDYRPDDASDHLTGFKNNNYDSDDNSASDRMAMTAKDISNAATGSTNYCNYITVYMVAEYDNTIVYVDSFFPGAKKVTSSYYGDFEYYQYPGTDSHALFFDKDSVKAKDVNAEVKKFGKPSKTVKGLKYNGYTKVYNTTAKEGKNSYSDVAKTLKDGAKVSSGDYLNANTKFKGASVTVYVYKRGKDWVDTSAAATDVTQKVYKKGKKIAAPKSSTKRYKKVKYSQLLTVKSNGTVTWNYKYNPKKTKLKAKDGYSYYIFGNGVEK